MPLRAESLFRRRWPNGTATRWRDIVFRIGINLGDVIIEGDDIYGNGVNIAARLEGRLADPGGICLPGSVHDEVKSKVDVVFEDLGEQSLKNIEEPVRVYRIASLRAVFPNVNPDAVLALPDKPSIAVLPFTNMSGGSRPRLLRRWHCRGHHDRSRADALVLCQCPQFQLYLQGPRPSTRGRSPGNSECVTCSKAACANPRIERVSQSS